ncbi:hypothetical protein NJB14194_05380, partial [Mycobacterium montefiorense]
RRTRCWARMSGCRRSPNAMPGKARSAPRHCRGWRIIR